MRLPTNRWKMNRLGFVNFWLYKHQVFPLSEGKLLLRGQNASGKSITTQSFIPFILDGDRTPSRLDPFGSSDRKMDYYFLDSQGRDDSTGYLYLEFYKPETNQYKTIGIGQRAQRGKGNMKFWGFILDDGRRIDYDFSLSKSYGSDYVPLDKKECREIIGENNFFTESNREYKERVGKEIFGFNDVNQYEQFIRLLIKIRAPKLSKEFKPSKVYELLNESLQTLSEEDTATIVSAMQKMDDIALRLDNLNKSAKELKYITDEYQRYNSYILGKKAQQWQRAKDDSDKQNRQLSDILKALQKLQKEKEDLEQKLSSNEQRKNVVNAKLAEFRASGIEDQIQHRENLADESRKKSDEVQALKAKIEALNSELYEADRRKKDVGFDLESIEKTIQSHLEELDKYNATIHFMYHNEIRTLKEQNDRNAVIQTINAQLSKLKKDIRFIISELKDVKESKKACDEAAEVLETYVTRFNAAQKDCEQAEQKVKQEKDAFIEVYYTARKENQVFEITDEEIKDFVSIVKEYEGVHDQGRVQSWQNNIFMKHNTSLSQSKTQIQMQMKHLQAEITAKDDALDILRNQKESVPVRNVFVENNRTLLKENGIEAIPFYEVIDFNENVSDQTQVMMEQQLVQAGILDALVIGEKDLERARELLGSGNDTILVPDPNVSVNNPFFKVAEAIENKDIKETAGKILQSISADDSAKFVLKENGYFKNGIVEGYLHQTEKTQLEYIGKEARRRNLMEKIAELETEREALVSKKDSCMQEVKAIDAQLEQLQNEKENLPSCDDLNTAITSLEQSNRNLEQASRNRDEKETIYKHKQETYMRLQVQVNEHMKAYSYGTSLPIYQEIQEDVDAYEESYRDYLMQINQMKSTAEMLEHIEIQIADKEESIDEKRDAKNRLENEVEKIHAQIASIDELLNREENKNIVEEMQKMHEELNQLDKHLEEERIALGIHENNIQQKKNEEDKAKEGLPALLETEETLRAYYIEEARLGYVLTEDMSEEELCAHAEEVTSQVRDADKNRDVATMVAHLHEVFQKHGSEIGTSGITIEECFENSKIADKIRTRQIVTAVLNGRKVSVIDYLENIKQQISDTEMLIEQNDRELFEKILTDTISNKLARMIRDSRDWIQRMSELMSHMDSSMGLTFALKWLAKAPETENDLTVKELESILGRKNDWISDEDREKVSRHFRNEMQRCKREAYEKDEPLDYRKMVNEILDYRKWFEFRMTMQRKNEASRELTDRIFNTFSGGEKAMAMYTPLFAAINAQYKNSTISDYPRIIALDEAFAGVDDKNINAMFKLVEDLDFDYIMNSQVLWGCYESVHALRIAELLRPENAKFITVIFYQWNGKQKVLDEQI